MQTVKKNSLFDKIPTHDSKPPLPEYYPWTKDTFLKFMENQSYI